MQNIKKLQLNNINNKVSFISKSEDPGTDGITSTFYIYSKNHKEQQILKLIIVVSRTIICSRYQHVIEEILRIKMKKAGGDFIKEHIKKFNTLITSTNLPIVIKICDIETLRLFSESNVSGELRNYMISIGVNFN